MDYSYEYQTFLREKILEFLPPGFVRVGNKYHGRCPFCGDSKKSRSKKRGWIYLDTNCSYYCFNCGLAMSGIKLVEALSGAAYSEIRKEYLKLFLKSGMNSSVSARFELPEDEPSLFKLQSIVKPEWKSPLSDKAKEYLRNRKVLDAPFFSDPIYSYFAPNKDEFIIIPWKLNGIDSYYQVNDFQKIHSLKYIFPKDKKKTVAGLDNIDLSWPYIICFEGFYDSLFVKNGVCLGTKAITDYQLRLIKERFPKHQIVISFDNDVSGIKAMCKLLKRNSEFKYFRWFSETTKEKDINDFVIAKDNVNIFADEKQIEPMIIDKLLMKLWLLKNGLWIDD